MGFNLFYCGAEIWDPRPWLERTKSDAGGIAVMEKKANILPVYVENLYCGAANILKQELLSLGGELSVHKYAINCKVEYGDVLILATYKQYRLLYKKLAMQHWKLKELGQELKTVISNVMSTFEQKTQVLGEDQYRELKMKAQAFIPQGDIVKEMGDFSLLEKNPADPKVVLLATGDYSNLRLVAEYILALQSKGYDILIECAQGEEKWIMSFLRPNYLYPKAE